MPRLTDRLPVRSLDPLYRANSFLARRAGARDEAQERRRLRALERAVRSGGGDGGALLLDELPDTAEELEVGQTYRIRGAVDEADQYVTPIVLPDGTVEFVPIQNAINPLSVLIYGASTTGVDNEWTNMPSATTQLFGQDNRYVHPMDLVAFRQYRIVANVVQPGSANARLNAYYLDVVIGSDYLSGNFTDGAVDISTAPLSGALAGLWTDISATAKEKARQVTVVGFGGDGTADPRLGNIYVQFR